MYTNMDSQQPQAGYGAPPVPAYPHPQNNNYGPPPQGNAYAPLPNQQLYQPEAMQPLHLKLQGIDGVVIKQKCDLLEAITGIEIANEYFVYRKQPGTKTAMNNKILKYKEKSGYWSRQCLKGSCKPYDMKVTNMSENDDEECMKCTKDCACTYYCLNRQFMSCFFTEDGSNTLLGTVRDPFSCCQFLFEIYDENNALNFILSGQCCQAFFWCRCPCESCQVVNFD